MTAAHAEFARHCCLLAAGQLSPAESAELTEHAAVCSACREEIAQWEQINARVFAAGVDAGPSPAAPGQLRKRFVVRAIREGVPLKTPERNGIWRHAIGFSTAAAIALIVAAASPGCWRSRVAGSSEISAAAMQGDAAKGFPKTVAPAGNASRVPRRGESAHPGQTPRETDSGVLRKDTPQRAALHSSPVPPTLFAESSVAEAMPELAWHWRSGETSLAFMPAALRSAGVGESQQTALEFPLPESGRRRFHYDGKLANLSVAELRGNIGTYPPSLHEAAFRFSRPRDRSGENAIQ